MSHPTSVSPTPVLDDETRHIGKPGRQDIIKRGANFQFLPFRLPVFN